MKNIFLTCSSNEKQLFQILPVTVLLILTVFICHNRRLFYVICKTLARDLRFFYVFLKAVATVLIWTKKNDTVPKIFSKLARKHPHKVAYYYEDQEWTYEMLENFSNRIANYFRSQGYRKGDSIALLLENRPEYIGIWLGLSKIGVVTALINTNLVSSPLVHSIFAANNTGLIFGSNFSEAISQVKDEMGNVRLYEFKDEGIHSNYAVDLKEEIGKFSCSLPEFMLNTSTRDKLLFIYTSGTTGLPKAAIITHDRFMLICSAAYFSINLNPDDIFYNPLPLYHSSGGILAAGEALLFGISVVLRKKFSASNYWTDCKKYNCTVANYIGELCRYLLAAHKPGSKMEHKVSKMCGNGLRPEVWKEFADTFGIKKITEFYGSTEGNTQMVNMDGKAGSVGFIPLLATWLGLINAVIIRCDQSTGEPIRNHDGLFTKCYYGEPGLLVGKISQHQLHNAFIGYADNEDTQKKILRDVLVKGDAYFNTGDILTQDEFGYFYFKDRTGDTFRWKGENVATSEVEGVISNLLKFRDATVFGVEVPHHEGRAGMAAVVDPDKTLDLKGLAKGLKSNLPSYAVPVFLRTVRSLSVTGTFKLQKTELKKEGYDLEKIKDGSVYIWDYKNSEYVPFTNDIFNDIIYGRMKL